MKSVKKAFLLFILLNFCGILNARTREDVIGDADEYANLGWTVDSNNILDLKTYHYNEQSSTWTIIGSTDGIDDRAQERYNSATKQWDYSETGNRSWWPFYTGKVVDGEAYAFGVYHTTTMFKSKIEAVSEKWIAGKRDIDSLPIGSDYKGFAGIDCSGFVSKIWALNIDTNTYGLTNFSIKISSDKAKAGDMIDKVGTHVILFDHWIEPNKAAVLHSAGWSISSPAHVRRVIVDVATFTQKQDGLYYLNWATKSDIEKPYGNTNYEGKDYDNHHYYEFYSAFPQFVWLKNGNITDTVRVRIESGTKISTGTIRFVIDEG